MQIVTYYCSICLFELTKIYSLLKLCYYVVELILLLILFLKKIPEQYQLIFDVEENITNDIE